VKTHHLLLLGLFAILGVFRINAAMTETEFDAANKLYGQGKFAEAAAAYDKIIQTGIRSPALYFNLGDAYFRSSQIGRAVAAFRSAAIVTPRDPDVRANLQFARNQVSGPTLLRNRWEGWISHLSLNEWTWLSVVSFWLLFMVLIARQFRPQWRNNGLIFCVALAVLFFGAGLGLMTMMHQEKVAVVTAHEVAVHNGPFEESPSSFTANDGAEFEILDQKDDWFQVTDRRGRIGWLKRELVAAVPKV
jgi:tetratricopeptide (TPR) repeat protein